MKQKYFYLLLFFTINLLFGKLHSQTLVGSNVTLQEIGSTAPVQEGDSYLDSEFVISNNLTYDIDANQIICSFRNNEVAGLPLNFNFSGGTVTGITSITVNPTLSTLDITNVTSSVHDTGIGVTFDTGTTSNETNNFEQIVFDLVLESAETNTIPEITGATSNQIVNDTDTIFPFSNITTTDADGDQLSATISLDNNNKGALSGTGLSGTGPYTIASTSATDLQSKLRALSYNPADNRTATSETTTFTIAVNDGIANGINNETTVVSNAVSGMVSSVTVPANDTYIANENLDFIVTFNESIIVNTTSGTPLLNLTIGSTSRHAEYQSGGGTNALLFRYVVQSEELDLDGITVNSLTANGGTLNDFGQLAATLTLNNIDGTSGVLVDATPPSVFWTGDTDSDWFTASNWSTNTVPISNADIVIPTGLSNYPTAASSVTFNTITINSGASFIPLSTANGTIIYKNNIPDSNWHLIAPPVFGETIQDVINDINNDFADGTGTRVGLSFYSSSSGSAWFYSESTSTGSLESGLGVSIKLDTAGDLLLTGTAKTTDFNRYISTGSRDNYNLIGNPFTSYINSSTFLSDNAALLSEETIWVWNGTKYTAHNSLNPIEIAPGQAFFVNALQSGNVVFSASNRSHTPAASEAEETPNLKLFVERGPVKISTEIFYDTAASTGFDSGLDSEVISIPAPGEGFDSNNNDISIFSKLVSDGSLNLSVQTLPNENYETTIIPIGIIAATGDVLTFSSEIFDISNTQDIYLEDREKNIFTKISETTYTTTLASSLDGAGRFYIHTELIPSITSVDVPANGTYIKDQNLDFTINFTENVNVDISGGIPMLISTIGSTERHAIYLSGSGTNALLFRYTITTGDLDTDGIEINTLLNNGGTIKDSDSNDATLTLNNIGDTQNVLVDASLSINNEIEQVKFLMYPNPSSNYLNIMTTNASNFEIITPLGQTVKTFSTKPGIEAEIYVADLSEGIYFVNASSGASKKLMIKK